MPASNHYEKLYERSCSFFFFSFFSKYVERNKPVVYTYIKHFSLGKNSQTSESLDQMPYVPFLIVSWFFTFIYSLCICPDYECDYLHACLQC